jgi:Cu+-exporting ATPase
MALATTDPLPTPTDATKAEITLPVEGMTCAACQANVQRALTKTPGVEHAAVNLMTHQARVVFDPRVIDSQGLVDAVNATGYVSRLPDPAVNAAVEDEARERAESQRYRELLRQSLVSLALGAIAMIAAHGRHGGSR